ncbi:hypothetical protein [Ovoidimarina sediminis]|uniref:hypothetical protein n=1 Tax=Ovoidimarina sediminis TaxID=3079856 RepID=UPI00290DA20B|nr:hypothetical protein [Rhodophyticola sp. MJ-SS7]MDU8942149.1 hypothetical protein [Rhodophyticola sp. MJ-SS7]
MQARVRAILTAALAFILPATAGIAQSPIAGEPGAPLSAIDWLSDSVRATDDSAAPFGESGAATGEITVETLGVPLPDAIGLLPPADTGLPRALWGPASAEDVVARIDAVPRRLPPALMDLLVTVLLAEGNAPQDSGSSDTLLLAKVDRLLELGALERAAALLDRAGPDTPDRFRRYFDIALLRGREQEACDRLRARPEISPTYPARIFCLARGGDWPAAAVTLETANSLGILTAEEDLLLARFLDPDILGDDSIQPDPRSTSPLMFRMYEAIGEPLSTTPLPTAFAWADLRDTRGWKAQIEAAERLAKTGVLSGNRLIGLYLQRRPSASGGVWERVAAVQALERSLANSSVAEIEASLPKAWATMRAAGLEHALAAHYGPEVAELPLDGAAHDIALSLGLLSPAYQRVAVRAESDSSQTRFIIALARGVPETAIATDPLALAVRQGFGPRPLSESLQRYVEDARYGEALLLGITLFASGGAGDLDDVSDAIALFRVLGREEEARRAALQLLLQEARS